MPDPAAAGLYPVPLTLPPCPTSLLTTSPSTPNLSPTLANTHTHTHTLPRILRNRDAGEGEWAGRKSLREDRRDLGRGRGQSRGSGVGGRVSPEQERGAESHLAGQRRTRAWEGGEPRRGEERRRGGEEERRGGGAGAGGGGENQAGREPQPESPLEQVEPLREPARLSAGRRRMGRGHGAAEAEPERAGIRTRAGGFPVPPGGPPPQRQRHRQPQL